MDRLLVPIVVFVATLIIFGAIAYGIIVARRDQRALRRLNAVNDFETPLPPPRRNASAAMPRYRWLVVLIALVASLIIFGLIAPHSAAALFAIVFFAVIYLVGVQLEAIYLDRRQLRFETQLADSIDLTVSSLNAGSGVNRALEYAARESRAPFRPELEDVLARLRFGDEPQQVFKSMVDRVPLETVRLYTTTLSVHWEVGGSLGPTLSAVGAAIRDRIELSRRIRSMTAQARLTAITVLLATYFIAFVMYNYNPEAFRQMLSNPVGQGLVALAIFLQAIGIWWSVSISKPRF